jgi:antitoxin component YwqK of YwqJK toxin-antitoxin module
MIKIFISSAILFSICFGVAFSQTDTVYFNGTWQKTVRDSAAYFRPQPVLKGSRYLLKDYYISGALQMEGYSKTSNDDKLEGLATWYHENGKLMQKAMFVDGYQEGELIIYDTNGSEISRGVNKEGTPFSGSFYESGNGFYTLTFYDAGIKQKFLSIANSGNSKAKVEVAFSQDGKAKEGTFYGQAGNLIGKAFLNEEEIIVNGVIVAYYINPMVVESIQKIENGKYKGVGVGYYVNGKIKYFRYFDGDRNKTKEVYFNTEGRKCDSIEYKDGSPYNGRLTAFFSSFHDDARVSERPERITEYKNAVMHGTDQEFYPNGKLKSSTNYVKGVASGTRITCDSTGKVQYTIRYKDGYPYEGTHLTWDNSIEIYKEGTLTEETRFYPNGGVMYNKSLTHGITVYDESGKIISRLDYKDGQPYHGRTVLFSGGQISFEEEYKNGEKILECQYNEGIPTEKKVYSTNEKIVTQYYSNGKPKQETSYVNDYERENIYYAGNGTCLGKLLTNENNEISGTKYIFDQDSIVQIIVYANNIKMNDKKFYNHTLLYDIYFNGKSIFIDPIGNVTYTCIYKDGIPYSGTEIEFDDVYKVVNRKSTYSSGQLHGEQILYTYNYETEQNEKVRKETYEAGLKNGPDQEFNNGLLVKETNYKNGTKEGEVKCYDKDGIIIATGFYKDDIPWSGKIIDYAYNYAINMETTYKDGQSDGPLNYYNDGVLVKTEWYKEGMLEKSITFVDGNPKYTLIYKNNAPFEGIAQDYEGLSTYKNGEISEKTRIDSGITKSREIFNGQKSERTSFYSDGKIKSSVHFEDQEKQGMSTYFKPDGTVLAVGKFENDVPVAGKFIFFSNTMENAWIEVSRNKTEFVAVEMEDGKIIKRLRYDIISGNTTELTDEMILFMKMVADLFTDYDVNVY